MKLKIKNLFKDKINILLLLIILVSFFFRFYNFPLRYNFGDEEIREAVIGIQGARDFQAPLVGGFSSAAPFTWGPWFYYQVILSYLIFPNNYSPFIYLGLASVASVFFLYKIGEELEDKKLGLIMAYLGALSPALIISGTHLAFPNLTNVFATSSFWIFIKLIKHKISAWWSFAFGILLGIGINIHYQIAGLSVLLLLLGLFGKKRIPYFITGSLGLFITFLPTLLFELTNHWFNLRNLFYYYTVGKYAIYLPNRWLFYLRDFWPSFWADVLGVPYLLAVAIIISFFIVLSLMFYYKKINKALFLVLVAFVINFVFLRYYWGERFFGYLNYLRPFVFIFSGISIYSIYYLKRGKYIVFLVLIVLSVFVVPASFKRLTPDIYANFINTMVNQLEINYPNDKFELYICTQDKFGHYAAMSKSVLFALDTRKLLKEKSRKIAINSTKCKFKKGVKYRTIKNTNIIEITNLDDVTLKKASFEKYSFRQIYDTAVRWWYREQP